MNFLGSIKDNVLDLIFPIYCLVCGKDGVFLCADCTPTLTRLEKQKCIKCAEPSPFGKTHPECVSRNVLDGCISSLDYRDSKNRDAIRIFKYKFISDLSVNLAKLMADELYKQNLVEYFADFDIVPVPLHKRRLDWRGFNQAKLLAQGLSAEFGMNIDSEAVMRTKYTKPQVELKKEARKQNVTNAFAINKNVEGRKFLLIDDLITTGSTLNEIAKLLKQNKASEVWALTLAHG